MLLQLIKHCDGVNAVKAFFSCFIRFTKCSVANNWRLSKEVHTAPAIQTCKGSPEHLVSWYHNSRRCQAEIPETVGTDT